MPNILTRIAGLPSACLLKTATWLHGYPLIVELLSLAAVAGLLAQEAFL